MAHILRQIKGTKETTIGTPPTKALLGTPPMAPIQTSPQSDTSLEPNDGFQQTPLDASRFLAEDAAAAAAASAKYYKVKLVGRGAFGEAWLVRETGDPTSQYIAKVLNVPAMTPRQKQYAYSEIKCLASCNHPNVIRYVEDFDDGEVLLIIMEFADSGDLDKQIKQRAVEKRPFKEIEVFLMFLQLCLALDHIHRGRMMHRDIKTANIMLTSSGLLKIADFGFSRQYEDTVSGALGHTLCGTPYYLAPEIWRKQRYSKKADIWSLGVVLYEMMCLRRPFVAKSLRELADNVMGGTYLQPSEQYSSDLCAVLKALLEGDQAKRPNMSAVFRFPLVRDGLRVLVQACATNPNIKEDTQKMIVAHVAEIEMQCGAGVLKAVVPQLPLDVTHEGTVLKYSLGEGRSWCQRYLQLVQGELHIRETPEAVKFKRLSVERIQSVCPLPFRTTKREGAFAINITGGQATWIQAPTPADATTWIQKIQDAMGVS